LPIKANVSEREKLASLNWETLARCLFQAAIFLCLSLTLCITLSAQEKRLVSGPSALEGKSGQGQLIVTATVVSSVGIVIGPNGERVIVVANAPSGKDNLAAISPVRRRDLEDVEQSKGKKTQQGP
jgi:hypothetical protein